MLYPIYFQEKTPWYPLDGRLGCPQEKNTQPPPGIEL